MHTYWSSYSDAPNWAIWTLFAASHERDTLLGIMFDYFDRNQRQGVAIFNRSIEAAPPKSYPQRDAHVRRDKDAAAYQDDQERKPHAVKPVGRGRC